MVNRMDRVGKGLTSSGERGAGVGVGVSSATHLYSHCTRADRDRVNGMDEAEARTSFVMGTSSTLFNAGLLALNNTNNTSILINAMNSVLGVIGENQNDIALYPNSFANWTAQPNPVSGREVRVRVLYSYKCCIGDVSAHCL
jgi:hypothetical protein